MEERKLCIYSYSWNRRLLCIYQHQQATTMAELGCVTSYVGGQDEKLEELGCSWRNVRERATYMDQVALKNEGQELASAEKRQREIVTHPHTLHLPAAATCWLLWGRGCLTGKTSGGIQQGSFYAV